MKIKKRIRVEYVYSVRVFGVLQFQTFSFSSEILFDGYFHCLKEFLKRI